MASTVNGSLDVGNMKEQNGSDLETYHGEHLIKPSQQSTNDH